MNKKQKSLTNKGFSLVELIIVIAIMAVLVGALSPQYVKYLNKGKLSADKQLADGIRQAIEVTLLDPEVAAPAFGTDYADLPDTPAPGGSMDAFWTAVYSILGVKDGDALEDALKLDSAKGQIQYKVTSTKDVHVQIVGTDSEYTKSGNSVEVK